MKIRGMVKDDAFILMESCTLGNGKMIKSKEQEHISIEKERDIMANGKRTCETGKE